MMLHGCIRRRLLLIFLSGPLLCLSSGAPARGSEPEAEASLRTYVEVWNSGELDRLEDVVTPDFKRHGGPDESCASRQELRALIEQTRTIFKHLELKVEDHVTEAEKGAFRGSFYGVHREVSRIVEFPLMSMLRFEDGRIAEEWTLGNNFLALVGLGFQLTPPGFEVIEARREPAPEESEEPQAPPKEVER